MQAGSTHPWEPPPASHAGLQPRGLGLCNGSVHSVLNDTGLVPKDMPDHLRLRVDHRSSPAVPASIHAYAVMHQPRSLERSRGMPIFALADLLVCGEA